MATTPNILVVDAEPGILRPLVRELGTDRFHFLMSNPSEMSPDVLRSPTDLVIANLATRGSNPLEIVQRLTSRFPLIPLIVVVDANCVASAVEAMKNGATDFLVAPIHPAELRIRIDSCLVNTRRDRRQQGPEPQPDRALAATNGGADAIGIPPGTSLDDLERAAIQKALQYHEGNRTHAARTLGISVRTLQRKLKTWRAPQPSNGSRLPTNKIFSAAGFASHPQLL